ncbi:hypothetical protein [Streptomyces sp. 5-6(2022)]|uniref:hypothetical protein n=1 Tax=Streptomyces sp. 5-6(2022) TaxID=2936510 RepID=UPI0023B93A32|nr:hypothetical protein [Streptomyces sp. 5-6(2022)]
MTTPAEFRRRFLQTEEQQTSEFQKGLDAHIAKANQVRENANAQIQRIAARKDLTPEAKRAAAARVYKPAREQIQQLLDEHIAKVEAHKQQLARKAFGSDGSADPATAMMRRQARQQAMGIQDRRAAEEMLREAQFDGDTHLARAVARTAFENGWHSVVDQWNADGSNNAYMKHVVELMQQPDTSDVTWRFRTAASYASPEAGPDLLGLRDHEISRAAESGPEVAA